VNRRAFLKTTGASTALMPTRRAGGADAKPAIPGDDESLGHARQRVEKHRKSDGVIVVRGADGKPVANAPVAIEQLRHDFLFGSDAFMSGRIRETEREAWFHLRFPALFNDAAFGFQLKIGNETVCRVTGPELAASFPVRLKSAKEITAKLEPSK